MKFSLDLKALRKLAERMKNDKKLELIVYGALVLVGVLIYILTSAPADKAPGGELSSHSDAAASVSGGERMTEARLEEILSNIRGAGEVRVMITFDTGTEIVPAMSVDTQMSSSESSENRTESKKVATVSQSGGNQAIVLTEKQPAVRGVIVIAEGAADVSVRVNLQNAVKTVLGVDISCIEVFEMKSIDKE